MALLCALLLSTLSLLLLYPQAESFSELSPQVRALNEQRRGPASPSDKTSPQHAKTTPAENDEHGQDTEDRSEGEGETSENAAESGPGEKENLPGETERPETGTGAESETTESSAASESAENQLPGEGQTEAGSSSEDPEGEQLPQEQIPVPASPREEQEAAWKKPFREQEDQLNILLPYHYEPGDGLSAYTFNPACLNPLWAPQRTDRLISQLLYAPLHEISGGRLLGLLESFSYTEDWRTVELKLRKGLCWQDGQALTTRDIHFSLLKLALSPEDHPLKRSLMEIEGMSELVLEWQPLVSGDQNLLEEKPEETVEKSSEEPQPTGLLSPKEHYRSKNAPFTDIRGIEDMNDLVLRLHFQRDSRPVLPSLLSLGIVPAHVWWDFPADKWNENISAEMLYPAAGPYAFVQGEDFSADIQLEAKSGSGFSKAAIPRLALRLVPQAQIKEIFFACQPDLSCFDTLNDEEQREMRAMGYSIDRVPGDEVISLYPLHRIPVTREDVREGRATPFALPEVQKGLGRLILASPLEMESENDPAFSPEAEDYEARNLLAPRPRESGQEQLEKAREGLLRTLLELGKLTPAGSQEEADNYARVHPELRQKMLEALTLAYPSGDKDAEACAKALAGRLGEAGIELKLFEVQADFEKSMDQETPPVDFILRREMRLGAGRDELSLPLSLPSLCFVHRDLEHFEGRFPLPFTGAASWTLVR